MTSNPYQKAYNIVHGKTLDFISYKPRSVREVELRVDKYLGSKKLDLSKEEKINIKDGVFKVLEQASLVDDERYVRDFVSEKINSSKPISKYFLKMFLVKKGISASVIENGLDLYTDDIEHEKACIVAQLKLKHLKAQDKRKVQNKIYSHLISKGYNSYVSRSVVDTLIDVK